MLPRPIQVNATFGIDTPMQYVSLIYTDCRTLNNNLVDFMPGNEIADNSKKKIIQQNYHCYISQKYLARCLALISRQKVFILLLSYIEQKLSHDLNLVFMDAYFILLEMVSSPEEFKNFKIPIHTNLKYDMFR